MKVFPNLKKHQNASTGKNFLAILLLSNESSQAFQDEEARE